MATTQTDSKWGLSSSEIDDFQSFKTIYNSQLEALLYGTTFQPAQLEVNSDSPYGVSDRSFIMRFDQTMSHLQDTLQDIARQNPSLSSSIEKMNNYGVIDEHMIESLQRLSAAETDNSLLSAQIDAANTLVAAYSSLPQNLRGKIETSQLLFNDSDRETQAETLVSLLEDELGVSQDNGTSTIDPYTSHALASRLHEMKAQNPAEDTENFDPLKFDGRAINFLERVMQKQMAENGVNAENTEQFRFHMLSLRIANNYDDVESSSARELGDTMLLLDALKYMNTGRLPSGTSGDSPTVQNDWGQNADHYNIAFFNNAVYSQALNNRIHLTDVLAIDPREQNSWRNEVRDEAIERLRNKAENWTPDEFNDNQRAVQTLVSKLNHHENGGKNIMLTREELGIMAAEVMSIQAGRQGLEENQIDAAIRNRRFPVASADIHLVGEGMGVSQNILDLIDQRASEGHAIALALQKEPNIELAKSYLRPELREYYADKWSARFAAEGTHSKAPFEEYIELNRFDPTKYEEGIREAIEYRAQENYENAPTTRPELSNTQTSNQFQNVVGDPDSDPVEVAARDITDNEIIEGPLPLVDPADPTAPAIAQNANTG